MGIDDSKYILEPDAVEYLRGYKISYPKYDLAHNVEEAIQIADQIGYPVVLKIVSSDVIHKSDVGGVVLGLSNPQQVHQGFDNMLHRVRKSMPNASIKSVMVCHQVSDGIEVIVGTHVDAVFGHVIMFGLGGVMTEIFKDVTFRVAPIEYIDAEEMIKEVKSYPLLTGFRGQPTCDINHLLKFLLTVSQIVVENPEIEELDFNPVRLHESGLDVLDVRLITRKTVVDSKSESFFRIDR